MRPAQLVLALVVACDAGTVRIDDRADVVDSDRVDVVDSDRVDVVDSDRVDSDRVDSSTRIETAIAPLQPIDHVCAGEVPHYWTWPVVADVDHAPPVGVWSIDADGLATWQPVMLDPSGDVVSWCRCTSTGCAPVRFRLVWL